MLLLLIFAAVAYTCEDYNSWVSYYVQPSTSNEVHAVLLMMELFAIDFLVMPTVDDEGIALVRPKYQKPFTKALKKMHIKYRIHSDNIKEALSLDTRRIINKEKLNLAVHAGKHLPYDNYQQLEVIDKYLIDTAEEYPDKVTLVQPGKSFESRPLYYLKISTSNFTGSKPIIIIDGGMHAREWISPPTVTYAIHKLVENVTEPDLLDKFDWILFPMVNPDGYKYTFTHSRLWRKNRSKNSQSKRCQGVDINRNFAFEWMVSGSSSNPCDENYAGTEPFSEVETVILRDILQEHKNTTDLYISMHSYGNVILYPYAHDGSLPNNTFTLHAVGLAIAQTLNSVTKFGHYKVGNVVSLLKYKASGGCIDYAHSVGIPVALTLELPGLNRGANGFVVDPNFIGSIVQETWQGIVAGARMITMKGF